MTANGLVNVKAGGHLTAGTVPEGTANITAGTLHLTAGTGSSIGQEEHHLVVDTDRVSAKGVEVYLDFLKDVIIDHIQGDRVDIDVNGGVGAGDGVRNTLQQELWNWTHWAILVLKRDPHYPCTRRCPY